MHRHVFEASPVTSSRQVRLKHMSQARGRKTTMTTSPHPALLAQTRDSWHRVAEHVLAAGQYADTGKIGLRPVAGGFQTRLPLRDGRLLSVVSTQLVVTDRTGTRIAPITTLASAAQFAGVTPGMPASVYPPATPLHLDEPMTIDPVSAQRLADWYDLADTALRRFASDIGAANQEPVLWPEHFDIGITVDRVNYGASPGDDHIAQPYLYVGPHDGPPTNDDFWNTSFGAGKTSEQVSSIGDAVAFYLTGRERASS